MKIRNAVVAGIAAAFMACFATLSIAQSSPPNNPGAVTLLKLGTSVRYGTILSMNPAHMVVVRMHKGKPEQLELVLNSETVRRGDFVVGSLVTVHYRTENNRNIATSIQTRISPGHPGI